MKVLIIAYEYPPITAPQSLRWFYLANALVHLGLEVDILTTTIRDIWAFRGSIPAKITVHRCFPGPFIGLSGWLSGRLRSLRVERSTSSSTSVTTPSRSLEGFYRGLRTALNHILFPDLRTEWFPFARRALHQLFSEHRYNVLISSHEPGVDLMLGMYVQQKWRLPWIVDLADPVLTPYTPRWRRWLDQSFERMVCQRADHILVTVDTAQKILAQRHHLDIKRFTVLAQGFEPTAIMPTVYLTALLKQLRDKFVLVYTGTLYSGFREPSELIAALAAVPAIHWAIAGHIDSFARQLDLLGNRVHILGKIDHFDSLALQRHATVLVNLGNRQSYQIPGKLFEYLGATRPILQIAAATPDPTAMLLTRLQRGIVVHNHRTAIQTILEDLYRSWQQGVLDDRFDLSLKTVKDYSWSRQAERLYTICQTVCRNSL